MGCECRKIVFDNVFSAENGIETKSSTCTRGTDKQVDPQIDSSGTIIFDYPVFDDDNGAEVDAYHSSVGDNYGDDVEEDFNENVSPV